MTIARDHMQQLEHLLRPLAIRIANATARASVTLVDDSRGMQLVQLSDLPASPINNAENHQAYGLASVPLTGAEAVVVFPNGGQEHPLVVAVSDRRHRPSGGQPGDVTLYAASGCKVRMLATGDIEVTPAPGGKVSVHDGGTAAALALKADVDALKTWAAGHTHIVAGVTAGPASVTSATPLPVAPTASGTTVLKAE